MALTDAEIRALGFDLPTGTDLIRNGDDNITNNARAAANLATDLAENITANLLADAGAPRVRGPLPAEITALSQMNTASYNGFWHAGSSSNITDAPFEITQSALVEITIGSPANAGKQTVTDFRQSWWREANTNAGGAVSSWGPWRKYVDLDDLAGAVNVDPAAEAIKDLARADGWTAVYNPGDPTTTTIDNDGKVTSIHDGLGNLNRLAAESAESQPPMISRSAFGQLDGMTGGYIQGFYGPTHTGPATIMVLGRDAKPTVDSGSERRWLFDTRTGSGSPGSYRQGFFVTSSGGTPLFQTNGGFNSTVAIRHDTQPHLFRATYGPADDRAVTVDGDYMTETRGDNAAIGLTLGADLNGSNQFVGDVGLALIHFGEISAEKVGRMTRLVLSLAGLPAGRTRMDAATVAYSEDQFGNEVFVKGDPDRLNEGPTVASITKVMTLWLARKYLSDSDMSALVEVEAADDRNTGRIVAGEQASFTDLFALTGMPSDNTAPNVIARAVGKIILAEEDDEGGDPRARFISEMDAEATRLGYTGAVFSNPQFGALMSPRQVVDLFRRSMADPVLKEAHKLGSHTATITTVGGGTRSQQFDSSLSASSPFALPEVEAGKTGTNYGYGHVVTQWTDSQGLDHFTVILNTPSAITSRRYRELRKVITAAAA